MPHFARKFACAVLAACGLAAAAGPAEAAIVVCSEHRAGVVRVAIASDEGRETFVRGWYDLAPNQCLTLSIGYATGRHAFYAYSADGRRQWPGVAAALPQCIAADGRFHKRFPSAISTCPSGYALRNFERVAPVAGEIRYVLR
jgi:uncharacterized membrane protein